MQLANWIEENMGACSYVETLGVECPWCGIQRASVHLLRGEWWESLQLFPALIPMITLVLGLILHLMFRFEKGALYLKWNFLIVAGLIVAGYLLKLFL